MDDEYKNMLDEIQTTSDRKLLANLTLARILHTLTGLSFSYFFTLALAVGFYALSCSAMGIFLTPGDGLMMLTIHLVVFKLMIDAIKAERKRRRDVK